MANRPRPLLPVTTSPGAVGAPFLHGRSDPFDNRRQGAEQFSPADDEVGPRGGGFREAIDGDMGPEGDDRRTLAAGGRLAIADSLRPLEKRRGRLTIDLEIDDDHRERPASGGSRGGSRGAADHDLGDVSPEQGEDEGRGRGRGRVWVKGSESHQNNAAATS